MTTMNNTQGNISTIFCSIVIASVLLFSNTAAALLVGGISTSPSPLTVKGNQVSTLVINWSGNSDTAANNNVGGRYQVVSNAGIFSDIQGNFSINNNRRIASSQLIIGGLNPFSIREVVQVPRSVLFSAKKHNSTVLQYSRQFVDDSDPNNISTVQGTATLQITTSSGGALSIEQIDLRFSDNTLNKVVSIDEALTAKAVISHSGTGLLDAVWEIATPASTSGQAVFTTLDTTRKVLNGYRATTIETPLLPSNVAGNYLLRLRVKSPTVSFDILQLQYHVINNVGAQVKAQKIAVMSPQDKAAVNAGTEFRWQPISQAIAYRLELSELGGEPVVSENGLEKDSQKVISGILLAADKNASQLTKLAMTHIEPGKKYQWRILAFDQQGNIVGKSPFRLMWFNP